MTVKYTIVARGNPQEPSAPKKYYPLVKSSGDITLRRLAERIAEISTLSSIDVVAALEALLIIIPQELVDGNIVRLGDFGAFSLRIRSTGSDTEAEVSAHNITKALAGFRPGKRFKTALDNMDFEKA